MPAISSESVRSLLDEAKETIPEHDAIWLLSALLSRSRGELLLDRQQSVHNQLAKKYRTWVRERARGKPLQYVAGFADFWGRRFAVDENVLIPRPETETLVELALAEGDRLATEVGRPIRVVDVGTGSGAIAVTMKLERPTWSVCASDISANALARARSNAKTLGAALIFRRSDLMAGWGKGEFDLLVANLPYVWRGNEFVEKQVRDWEPGLALFPKRDSRSRMRNVGAHLAERMIADCLENRRGIRAIVLELSAAVAYDLERRFRKDPRIVNLARPSDLAGRRRFLRIGLRA